MAQARPGRGASPMHEDSMTHNRDEEFRRLYHCLRSAASGRPPACAALGRPFGMSAYWVYTTARRLGLKLRPKGGRAKGPWRVAARLPASGRLPAPVVILPVELNATDQLFRDTFLALRAAGGGLGPTFKAVGCVHGVSRQAAHERLCRFARWR